MLPAGGVQGACNAPLQGYAEVVQQNNAPGGLGVSPSFELPGIPL